MPALTLTKRKLRSHIARYHQPGPAITPPRGPGFIVPRDEPGWEPSPAQEPYTARGPWSAEPVVRTHRFQWPRQRTPLCRATIVPGAPSTGPPGAHSFMTSNAMPSTAEPPYSLVPARDPGVATSCASTSGRVFYPRVLGAVAASRRDDEWPADRVMQTDLADGDETAVHWE
jgi:hypothetical protein